MIEEFQFLVRSSIFDNISEQHSQNNSPKSETLLESFENYLQNLQTPLVSRRIYSGKLVYQDASGQVQDLIVDLYEDKLVAYLDSKRTQIYGIIKLEGVKLEFTDIETTDDDEIEFLFFYKNFRWAVFFCEFVSEFEEWVKNLRPLCVLANFAQFYAFEKVIGKGSSSKVVLCQKKNDCKKYAVKLLDKSQLKNAHDRNQQIAAIQNEVNIMKEINHPNIIKMHEIYEGEKHIYIVMESLTGGELFKRIYEEKHFTENTIISLMRNLLQSLEYLHAKNIMHRDIKPENLIIRDKLGKMSDIVLADFGLSECGTAGYIAPEILQNQDYGTKVDVFSAGIIMYILLTGCSPFYGKNYMEIFNRNKTGDIDFNFKEMECNPSEKSIDLMKMMLQKDPNDRITAKEALQHEWFQEKKESFSAKVHHQAMEKLLYNQKLVVKATRPEKMTDSQNIITNSPLLSNFSSQQNSGQNTPVVNKQAVSPQFGIGPIVEKKSKFAQKK